MQLIFYSVVNFVCEQLYIKSLCLACLQELLRRWEQFVNEHQTYCNSQLTCSEWQKDLANRLSSCIATNGDKYAIQNRLGKLQVGTKSVTRYSYAHVLDCVES